MDTLRLLPGDRELTLRVFVDRQVVEAYWMDGRVAMTSQIRPQPPAVPGTPQVGVFAHSSAGAAVKVVEAAVWELQSIWVTKEQVLATPRQERRHEQHEAAQ